MLTPADLALHAADRMLHAVEALLDHNRRSPIDKGGFPPALTLQTRASLIADLDRLSREYRSKAQRVPKDQPA